MKRSLALFLTTIFMLFLVTECDRPENPNPEPKEFGYLSLSVGLQVEAQPASGRIEAVSPDNFLVTIHDASDGSEVMRWDTYLEVPEEVQLPTGSYFVRATNLEFPAAAAIEQPWYYGESEVFTIDKEEFRTVNVECTLANCKISFSYSQNVLDNFTNWDATATIDDGSSNPAFLEWIGSDPAEGYFLIDNPINIEVYLEYEKAFEDALITRTFNHTISDPAPATHYLVNIDALLEDGKIMINITVDDDFDTVEIPLRDEEETTTVTDIDGNEYATVQIGEQVWMAENLAAESYNDGTSIPNIVDFQEWSSLLTPGYVWYNNDINNKDPYGALYNWYTIESGNLCPVGWHVATTGEWGDLINYFGGEDLAGGKLKESGFDHWVSPNSGATNESGFTALPGGLRGFSDFTKVGGGSGHWWSSTEWDIDGATNAQMYSNVEGAYQINNPKFYGFSVRCIKD